MSVKFGKYVRPAASPGCAFKPPAAPIFPPVPSGGFSFVDDADVLNSGFSLQQIPPSLPNCIELSDQDVFCESLHLSWKLKISQQKTREIDFAQSNFTLVFHPKLSSSILYLFLYEKHISGNKYKVRVHLIDCNEQPVFETSYEGLMKHGPVIWSLAQKELQNLDDTDSHDVVTFKITINVSAHTVASEKAPTSQKGQTKVTNNKPAFSDLLLSSLHKLSDDCGKLYNNENADVVLECDGHKISAHRMILSARSDVFTAMFRNDMIESKNGVVNITDVKSAILEKLIRYIYTGKIDDLSMEVARHLYEAADKYAVEFLKKCCVAFMLENLSYDSACDVFLLADAHGDTDLKDYIASFMAKNKEFLRTDMWDKFSEEHSALAVIVYKKFARTCSADTQSVSKIPRTSFFLTETSSP